VEPATTCMSTSLSGDKNPFQRPKSIDTGTSSKVSEAKAGSRNIFSKVNDTLRMDGIGLVSELSCSSEDLCSADVQTLTRDERALSTVTNGIAEGNMSVHVDTTVSMSNSMRSSHNVFDRSVLSETVHPSPQKAKDICATASQFAGNGSEKGRRCWTTSSSAECTSKNTRFSPSGESWCSQLRFSSGGHPTPLSETELRDWEALIHKISSAYSVGITPPLEVLLPCCVDEEGSGLFLSDAASARDVKRLRNLGIGAVMNCGAPTIDYPPDFEHLEVCCEDTEGYPLLARHLDECINFFQHCEAAHTGLVVHCVLGINRSACLVVALLVAQRGIALLDAVRRVWERRGHLPFLTNSSFRSQLVELAHFTNHLG